MSHLINTVNDMNEKILLNTFSTIPDGPSPIDRNQESWCLGDFDQNLISSHQFDLDQSQTFDQLASFHFNEIELDCECESIPSFVIQFQFLNHIDSSILT